MRLDLPPHGMPRYALASSVSQWPDKFVAFDNDCGVPEMNTPACALKPERNITSPHVTFPPFPEYTDLARKKKINATVVVSLTAAVDGTTRDIKVVQGVGYGLDEKAVEAVSRWKFTPALKDGQPIEKEISVEVSFHLYNVSWRFFHGGPTMLDCETRFIDSSAFRNGCELQF
jgi:TonB family protein